MAEPVIANISALAPKITKYKKSLERHRSFTVKFPVHLWHHNVELTTAHQQLNSREHTHSTTLLSDVNGMEIDRIVSLLESRELAKQADLVGVSPQEIAQLERRFGIQFPAAYQQFLRSFGRSAGYLSTWMAIYFDDLIEIREEFDQLIEFDALDFQLPKNALLISHLDGVFDYIFCDGSDDPQVYRINLQGDNGAFCEKYAHTFSAYLEKIILLADGKLLLDDSLQDASLAAYQPLSDEDVG